MNNWMPDWNIAWSVRRFIVDGVNIKWNERRRSWKITFSMAVHHYLSLFHRIAVLNVFIRCEKWAYRLKFNKWQIDDRIEKMVKLWPVFMKKKSTAMVKRISIHKKHSNSMSFPQVGKYESSIRIEFNAAWMWHIRYSIRVYIQLKTHWGETECCWLYWNA